ncbi:MAG: hypothetical protein PHT79_06635 [Syntrophomonadaceae bacterium]|nr:hypothetical protein [Syntrophomonadaceae bacterium]MDD3897950.1 hypothetical protein [Syntrophomonadaceae bacterium]MDD4549420.1 hypothetical protein [Syntrophomonadaceae bacterium]
MANSLKISNGEEKKTLKEVNIKLDRERTLKLDLNAFCLLEQRFENIDRALKELERGSMQAIRTLLWTALAHEDPLLTEEEAGKLVTIENIEEVVGAIAKALGEAKPRNYSPGN